MCYNLNQYSTRDCIIYAASAFSSNVGEALQVLAEAVWHPLLTEDEVLSYL